MDGIRMVGSQACCRSRSSRARLSRRPEVVRWPANLHFGFFAWCGRTVDQRGRVGRTPRCCRMDASERDYSDHYDEESALCGGEAISCAIRLKKSTRCVAEEKA